MKNLLLLFVLFLLAASASAQSTASKLTAVPEAAKPLLTVEASCGQCQFGLEGKACDLAVRMDGKAYFVDGTTVDSHGDAHAPDGFCSAVRRAEVQGEVVENRFQVTYFRLLPVDKTKP